MELGFLKNLPVIGGLFFSGSKSDSVLGIDIGSSSVKVVQIRKEKERAILETYGELSTGIYGGLEVGQATVLVEEKMIEMLKDLFKEANVTAKEAIISIPLKSSFVTVIELPEIPEGKEESIISIEARRHIPIPLSEVLLDWWIIPESESEKARDKEKEKNSEKIVSKRKMTRVLLTAIHKDVMAKYKNIALKVGLEAQNFELEVFSIIRSSIRREISPILLIDFGATTTKMAIIDYGILRMSYTLNRGAQDLSMALSKSLNIDFARAEETKREIGISSAPEHKEIVSVMTPVLDYILSEANSVIINYQNKYNRAVSRAILTGGGAPLKGLVDMTVKRLNIEVNLADPFAKVEYPAFLNNVLTGAGPSFSTALGLALRKLQS